MKKNIIYSTLGTLVISATMATAQNQDERIKLFEDEINTLKAQLDQIKDGTLNLTGWVKLLKLNVALCLISTAR